MNCESFFVTPFSTFTQYSYSAKHGDFRSKPAVVITLISADFIFLMPPSSSLYIWSSLWAWYSSTIPRYGRNPSIDFVSPDSAFILLYVFRQSIVELCSCMSKQSSRSGSDLMNFTISLKTISA